MANQNRQSSFHGVPPTTCLVSSNNLQPELMHRKTSNTLQIDFIPSQLIWLLAHISPRRTMPPGHPGFTLQSVTSFHRPGLHNYYGIICHLTPLRLTSGPPLRLPFPEKNFRNDIRFPRLKQTPCEQSHPQSRYGVDQVLGVALCGTLTLPLRRIRFTYVMYRSLSIASFRPCRCQQRPCDSNYLPPDQGDACIPQAGFVRYAGQTSSRVR